MESVETIPFDNVFDALSHIQRRKLLMALAQHNPQDPSPVSVAEDETEAEAVEQIINMRHIHLPKLEEYGFIEWDREAGEVTKGPKFEEIRPLLELLDDHQDELPSDWL